MIIRTEDTPNVNAVKFFPDVPISLNVPLYFQNAEEAADKSLLAVQLFKIHGVDAVFFGANFITITKSKKTDWGVLKSEIIIVLTNYFLSNNTVLINEKHQNSTNNQKALSDIEKQIVDIIETRVRPAVAMDGGDIIYKNFENGIVKVALRGACSGCPSSHITLKNGIESMLQHFIPEVLAVEAVSEYDD